MIGGGPVAGGKLFFALAPHWLLMPMVVLATAATIIASQALISGAFSLVSQAIRLGLFPRLKIEHTHHAQEGQVYIPVVNWMLLIGCATLVWSFGSSSALAAAYGLAVSGVMVITSVAMIPVALRHWNWSPATTALVWGPLTALNAAFLHREPAEAVRRRLCADRGRSGGVRGDGDLALGPQGDLRRAQRQGDDDGRRGRLAAPVEPPIPRAQRAHHVAAPLALAPRPRAVTDPPHRRAHRRPAAKSHLRRGRAQEDALHPRQPLSGDGVRPRGAERRRDRGRALASAFSRSRTSSGRSRISPGITRSTCRPTRISGSCT